MASGDGGQADTRMRAMVQSVLDQITEIENYRLRMEEQGAQCDERATVAQTALGRAEASCRVDRLRLREAKKWLCGLRGCGLCLGCNTPDDVKAFIQLLKLRINRRRDEARQLDAVHLDCVLRKNYYEAEQFRVADLIDKLYANLLALVGTGLDPNSVPSL